MSRLNSASMCTDSTGGITPVMMRNSNETLKQLEFHFHMSVLQEGISADPSRAINAINTVNHSNTGACYGPHTRYQKPTNSNAAAMNALLKTWNRQTIANVSTLHYRYTILSHIYSCLYRIVNFLMQPSFISTQLFHRTNAEM